MVGKPYVACDAVSKPVLFSSSLQDKSYATACYSYLLCPNSSGYKFGSYVFHHLPHHKWGTYLCQRLLGIARNMDPHEAKNRGIESAFRSKSWAFCPIRLGMFRNPNPNIGPTLTLEPPTDPGLDMKALVWHSPIYQRLAGLLHPSIHTQKNTHSLNVFCVFTAVDHLGGCSAWIGISSHRFVRK